MPGKHLQFPLTVGPLTAVPTDTCLILQLSDLTVVWSYSCPHWQLSDLTVVWSYSCLILQLISDSCLLTGLHSAFQCLYHKWCELLYWNSYLSLCWIWPCATVGINAKLFPWLIIGSFLEGYYQDKIQSAIAQAVYLDPGMKHSHEQAKSLGKWWCGLTFFTSEPVWI